MSICNICTCVHFLKMYNLFVQALKRVEKWVFCQLFWPVSQRLQIKFIFSHNALILCLSCNVKKSKQKPNYPKRAETSIVLIIFNGVLYHICTYTESVSHCCSTWKAISWSVSVYSKDLSSQCNLTAKIKPVQDKKYFLFTNNITNE